MNNGRPNNTNGFFGNAPQQGGTSPYAGYPQQPMQTGYGYAQNQQPAQNGYGYTQNQQPTQNGYGYTQNQQPAQNVYGYAQNQQPVQNGYGYTQNQQPAQTGYGYAQNQQPVQSGYGYAQNQPPMQGGVPRVQSYPQQVGGTAQLPTGQGGVRPAPAAGRKKRPLNVDRLTRLIVFLALPILAVLFVLGLVFGNLLWLKWAFAIPALAVILALWVRPVMTSDLRLTTSFVLGAMVVIALVGALSGAPADDRVSPGQGVNGQPGVQQTGGNTQSGGGENPGALVDVTQPVSQPTPAPTDPPAVSSGLESDAVRQLESFLHFWSSNDTEKMIGLCAPSWVRQQTYPLNSLFTIVNNRTPEEWEALAISGTENDLNRTVSMSISLHRNNGQAARKYMFKVIMVKENDNWYVMPESLVSNEPEATPTPESSFITQPPAPAAAEGPSQTLYYNPNGGTRYHINPDCPDVGEKYKPMATFTFGQINDSPYSSLSPCNRCGAPRRE